MSTSSLPSTSKAVVLHEYGKDLVVEDVPTPQPVHGHVVIKVESSPVYGPWKEVMEGKSPFMKHPTPFTPGGLTVGRVAAVSPDTTTLTVGQLVLTDYFQRASDNPDGLQYLRSGGTFGIPGAEKLADIYRSGGMAEYMLVSHANCHILDEKLFLGSPADGGLGFTCSQLALLGWHAICYAGLRDIELQAGETIAVLPATGTFGGMAVELASAMGARVIACGRNVSALKKLTDNLPNVKSVQLSGDATADTKAISDVYGGPIDTFMDISAPTQPNLDHTKAAFGALKTYGRASLMGGRFDAVPLSYGDAVFKSLTIKGRFMYAPGSVKDTIKLAAGGGIKPSRHVVVKEYKLSEWKEALGFAEKEQGWGKIVAVTP